MIKNRLKGCQKFYQNWRIPIEELPFIIDWAYWVTQRLCMSYRDSNTWFYSKETSLILLQQWCKKQPYERTRSIEAPGFLQLQAVRHSSDCKDLDHCIFPWQFDNPGRQNSLFPTLSLSNQHKWFPFLQKGSYKILQANYLSNKNEDNLFSKTSCGNTSALPEKEMLR